MRDETIMDIIREYERNNNYIKELEDIIDLRKYSELGKLSILGIIKKLRYMTSYYCRTNGHYKLNVDYKLKSYIVDAIKKRHKELLKEQKDIEKKIRIK